MSDDRFDKEKIKTAICKLNENQVLARSLPQLLWSDGLALAAKEQCEYIGPNGGNGSIGEGG
jgi:hypothetical protein